jgi:hypothetical protein
MEISDKMPGIAAAANPQSSAEKSVSRPADDTPEPEARVVDKVDIKVKDVETEGKIEEKRAPSKLETRRTDDTLRPREEPVEKVDFKDKEAEALKKVSVYA